jgi:rare lipoprotein A
MHPNLSRLAPFLLALVLAGCGGNKIKPDGPGSGRISELPGDAVPKPEPRSKYGNGRDMGNGPEYVVWEKTYRVMDTSAGYSERGVASWYGKKFHGNPTSSQEPYDMYAMTAAHKTLPLPTYVKVRNLRNNKTITVRVNDRGPFVHNRIIDLSYAAALKLDMVRDGTSLVEVTAISFDEPKGDRPVSAPSRRAPTSRSGSLVSTPAVATAAAVAEAEATKPGSPQVFVQVGAFGDRANAARRLAVLSQSGVDTGFIYEDKTADTNLYRVRIGPVSDVAAYDRLVDELATLGITDPYLITE